MVFEVGRCRNCHGWRKDDDGWLSYDYEASSVWMRSCFYRRFLLCTEGTWIVGEVFE